jgi:hypothetical protein
LKSQRIPRATAAGLALAVLWLVPGARLLRAQIAPSGSGSPASALAEALQAACRQDADAFANLLTADNAAAFRNVPPPQRLALLKRFVLLEDPGKPLLSSDAQGHTVMRCEAAGVTSEVRFGTAQVHDNLAFIPVEVPQAGEGAQTGRFGLVREDGQWKLLSLGLLLLDVPALQREWAQVDLEGRESQAVQSLRKIADALERYREAYGRLPEALDQLGPAAAEGNSPEKAGFLNASLATGEDGGYRFRYSISPVSGDAPDDDRDKLAKFQLAATPIEYGKDGQKSFYLDSAGALHGADKHGTVATVTDPTIRDPQP